MTSSNSGKLYVFIFLVLTILCAGTSYAALISGDIYDISLEKAKDVIIEIDTSPKQKFISKDGSYNFNVLIGNYSITAGMYSDNLLEAFASENISITSEGEYRLDLIIFPYLGADEELGLYLGISVPEKLFEEDYYAPDKEKKNWIWVTVILILVILILAITAFFIFQTRKSGLKKEEIKAEQAGGTLISVTKDLQDLIDIIKKEGGRTTQKEIRKHIPLSEAKISLMISELEDKGIIKKIKKGRGNIIILKV